MIYAGTGHRPKKLGGYDNMDKLGAFAIEICRELKPDHIISGMALGWDLALAEAAVGLRIPWTAAVPFEGQESQWPKHAQERYSLIRDRATCLEIVSDGGYAIWKMQTRNEWMVDEAHTMLALWNGDQAGGTYNCVRYAERRAVPIINVWDKWEEFQCR